MSSLLGSTGEGALSSVNDSRCFPPRHSLQGSVTLPRSQQKLLQGSGIWKPKHRDHRLLIPCSVLITPFPEANVNLRICLQLRSLIRGSCPGVPNSQSSFRQDQAQPHPANKTGAKSPGINLCKPPPKVSIGLVCECPKVSLVGNTWDEGGEKEVGMGRKAAASLAQPTAGRHSLAGRQEGRHWLQPLC